MWLLQMAFKDLLWPNGYHKLYLGGAGNPLEYFWRKIDKLYAYFSTNLILSSFMHFWATKDLLWPKGRLKLYWGGGPKELTYKFF